MATRVGIELSPTACRIVELERGDTRRPGGETHVRSFAVLPPSGPQTVAALAALRRRSAAVVVWGGRTEHQQIMVTAGSYESMRAEAMAELSSAGLLTGAVWVDIAAASTPDRSATRRPVLVTLASAADMADAVRPLRDAGIRLGTVTTPAAVLGSLARWRPASTPETIEPYVAFDEQVTCIALVRGGVLLAARDLAWGYVQADYAGSQLRPHDEIASRLAAAISEFVVAVGGSHAQIGAVCVCGGLPGLRSMSVMLMERLDVEVEPLDSMFGIDAARLPAPVEEFRERAAELRLAWAAAAEWPPTINLLRARRRHTSTTWLARAAVVAGAAAGVGGGWWLVEGSYLSPRPQPVHKVRSAGAPRASAAPHIVRPAAMPTTAPLPSRPPVPAGSPAAAPAAFAIAATVPAVPVVPKAPDVTSPAAAVDKPGVEPSRAMSPPALRRAMAPPRVVARDEPVPSRPTAPPAEGAPLPFDAALRTILFSPERQLAIVDGRIVGVGDEVRGARVVEITAAAVMLRDGQGRLRRLTFETGAR